jgi:hypothetical protein
MPTELLARIDSILSDGDPSNDASVLSLVPFYEVHLTKLADWMSRDTDKNKAKVTSNNIPDQNNVVDDGTLDGGGSVYSRGLAQPQPNAIPGDTVIIATARKHNTGVTNTAAINPSEDDTHPVSEIVTTGTSGPYYYTSIAPESSPAEHKDGSITVAVGGGISISGAFQKAAGSPKPPNNIGQVSGSNGAECTTTGPAAGKDSYTCTVPANWTGSITFSSSQSYSFCLTDSPACGPATALSGGVWTISSEVTGSITQDVWAYRP